MYPDPTVAASKIVLEQSSLSNQQFKEIPSGNEFNAKFEKFLSNPKAHLMDPNTLALMKTQQPDVNLAQSVMKSVKDMFKDVNGSLEDLGGHLKSIEVGKPMESGKASDIIGSTLKALNYATISTVATGAVPKTVDTLIKAQ